MKKITLMVLILLSPLAAVKADCALDSAYVIKGGAYQEYHLVLEPSTSRTLVVTSGKYTDSNKRSEVTLKKVNLSSSGAETVYVVTQTPIPIPFHPGGIPSEMEDSAQTVVKQGDASSVRQLRVLAPANLEVRLQRYSGEPEDNDK